MVCWAEGGWEAAAERAGKECDGSVQSLSLFVVYVLARTGWTS